MTQPGRLATTVTCKTYACACVHGARARGEVALARALSLSLSFSSDLQSRVAKYMVGRDATRWGPHGWRRAPRDPVTPNRSYPDRRRPERVEGRRVLRDSDGRAASPPNPAIRRRTRPLPEPFRAPDRKTGFPSSALIQAVRLAIQRTGSVAGASRQSGVPQQPRASTDGRPPPSIHHRHDARPDSPFFFFCTTPRAMFVISGGHPGRQGASDWLALNYIRIV